MLGAACARVPYTGRTQFILVSAAEEARLGAEAYRDVLAKSQLDHREVVVGPVQETGRRLAAAADRPDFDWRFVVIDDPKTVNAFCLPGGKVAVYSGILPVMQDTNGVAVVLGHEIGHAIARHGAERMSQAAVLQFGGTVLSEAAGGRREAGVLLAAYGLGAQLGVLLPYGRAHESEADHIGLILMAKAGYDPHGALAFWQRMEQGDTRQSPEFLSTHPSGGTREAQIAGWMSEAMAEFERAPKAPVDRLS